MDMLIHQNDIKKPLCFFHRQYAVFFLAFFVCNAPVKSQAVKKLNHISYNVNEGLLHSQVMDLVEDGNGFIWISSGSGMQRFDGKNFFSIPIANDNSGIPDDKYVHLFRLQNGNLWLGHSRGISEYDIRTNRFQKIVSRATSDPDKYLLPVFETNDGVWCRLGQAGLYLLDKRKGLYTDSIFFPGISKERNIVIVSSPTDGVVFAKFDETAIILAGKKFTKKISAGKLQGMLIGLVEYKPDTLLVATQRGIEKMDIQTGSFHLVCTYTSPALVATKREISLCKLNNGNYLVNEGLDIYEVNVEQTKYLSRLVDLQNQNFVQVGHITSFLPDSLNNFWILSESEGIRKVDYRSTGFSYYGTNDKRKNFIKTIYADKNDNRVLCGTVENGLMVFDTLQQLIKTIDHFPGASPLHTIGAVQRMAPHQYLLFLQGEWKAYLLNTLSFSLKRIDLDTTAISPGNLADYHMSIFRLNDEEIIVQNSYAIYKIKWQGKSSLKFTAYTGISTASVSSCIDRFNRFWVGGRWKYFMFQDEITSFQSFDVAEKVIVRAFYTDPSMQTWMGTEKGLYQLDKDGKIIRKLYRQDGLADENIYAVCGDKKGNLWMSHNKGISCMTSNGHFFHYNKYDGLQENEFNTNCVFETTDGELFFGGVNGVSSFYPETVLKNEEQPGLFVTSIKIKDTEWKTDTAVWNVEHMDLNYLNSNLAFEFTVGGVKQPDQYNYQYRMLGVDEAWVNSFNRGLARYSLVPGKYVLELYGGNSFSKDAVPLKRIAITILPPFWKTNLFIVVTAIFLATILFLLIRYLVRIKLKSRIKELERKRMIDEERLRISREMHDDIGAGLTQITMMSEHAKKLLHDGSGKTHNEEQLNKIAHTSRKLVSDMGEIIWSMNPEQNTLDQLLGYLREQLRQLLEYSGIAYKIDFPENGKNVTLNNAQKRNLLLVAKEIVHNAIKHSTAKEIQIKAVQEKRALQFSITDNGCGFDTLQLYRGNGLRNIKKRIAELGGTLSVTSTPGNGCCFAYEIPL
ncbi:MAG: two-component regulator propeller domain-containing protein [Bacteroidota bacterium]